MHKLPTFPQAHFMQSIKQQCTYPQMTNPPFKQWSLHCAPIALPCAHRLMCDRPAQPDTRRCDQRVQEHYLVCSSKNGFNECFLFLTPIIPNNPDIDDVCLAVGSMPTLPFI